MIKVYILVEALSKVKIDFTFNIDVDHIEDNSYFENLITKIKKDSFFKKIKFIKCDHFTISKYMRKSDLVVVPSVYPEQYGRVIQESVACGCLVIGSNVGAIPEIINDKDLIFEKGNSASLATLITNLNNKKFYKMKFKKLHSQI